MMEKVGQFSWDAGSVVGRGYDSLLRKLRDYGNATVCVEVYAEVETCCDKYRGRTVTIMSGPGGTTIVDRIVKHCPECGKLLEGA